jgi:hypothetical protein
MRRLVTRLSLIAVLAIGAAAIAGPGSASAALQICTGAGKLTAQNPTGPLSKAHWQVSGNGQCNTPQEVKSMTFAGKGTSKSLGLCTSGHLLVENLNLGVYVTLTGVVTGNTHTEFQRWSAPLTVFPLATPFLVYSGGGGQLRGPGVVIHHIHLMCGDDGSKPSAVFTWALVR